MKKLFLLIAFAFIIGIYSCKKGTEESTSLIVTLYDGRVQKYLANRDVVLIEDNKRSASNNFSTTDVETILKEGTTDSNGKIDFGSFDAVNSKNYFYWVRDKSVDNAFEDKSFSVGQNNNITITEYGNTWVKVNLLPPPPYPVGDSLYIEFFDNIRHTNFAYWSFNSNIHDNFGNFARNNFPVHEHTNCVVHKFVSGVNTSTSTSYYFSGFDTTTYQVNINVTW